MIQMLIIIFGREPITSGGVAVKGGERHAA